VHEHHRTLLRRARDQRVELLELSAAVAPVIARPVPIRVTRRRAGVRLLTALWLATVLSAAVMLVAGLVVAVLVVMMSSELLRVGGTGWCRLTARR